MWGRISLAFSTSDQTAFEWRRDALPCVSGLPPTHSRPGFQTDRERAPPFSLTLRRLFLPPVGLQEDAEFLE